MCACVCVRASIHLSSVCVSMLYATYVSTYVSMHVSVPGYMHLFLHLSMHLSASVSIYVALRFTECVSMLVSVVSMYRFRLVCSMFIVHSSQRGNLHT